MREAAVASTATHVEAPDRIPRLLILGGGAVVAELYLPALLRLGWAHSALIVDSLPHSTLVLRDRYPAVKIRRGDYAEVFDDPAISGSFDGAVVALPNHLHEDGTLRCLRAGLHVLCEKPLAVDSDVCVRLAATAQQQQRVLAIGMVRRLIPAVTAIREALKSDLIGKLRDVEIHHGGGFSWPSHSGHYFRKDHGGILVNMGVHYLDMVEDWAGPLTPSYYKDDHGGGIEANCDFRLFTSTGAAVRLSLSNTHALRNTIVVTGSRGQIVADVNKFDSCTWRSSKGLGGTLRASHPFVCGDWPEDFVSSFAQQLIEFVSAIEGKTHPRVDGYQAASTVRIVEWAYAHRRSLYSKAATVGGIARPALGPAPVVVTGGTGFLGGKLVERLAELRFDDIRIPVRSYLSGANVARFAVDRVLTDLLNPQSLDRVVKGARYVFHLAHGTDGKLAPRVTVEGTKNVINAAIRNQCEVVVVISTASVFGHPQTDRSIDETFPYQPALGAYGRSKAVAERYALKMARVSRKTRIVVLNPSAIYGPGGKLFTEFPARATKEGYFAWVESGTGKLNYTFVDNVVDAMLLAAARVEAHGRRFIISDGVCTCRDFLSPIIGEAAHSLPSFTRAELLDRKRRARPTLHDFVRALTSEPIMALVREAPFLAASIRLFSDTFPGLCKRLKRDLAPKTFCSAGGKPPTDPPMWIADIFGPVDTEYSSESARRVLGWQPLVTFSTGCRLSVEWLQHIGIASNEQQDFGYNQ